MFKLELCIDILVCRFPYPFPTLELHPYKGAFSILFLFLTTSFVKT